MKRLLFGKGKVSSVLERSTDVVLSSDECDISSYEQVLKSINRYKPDIIINCAAKTNLEFCEDNKISSFNSNTLGVLNIVDVCSTLDIKLVQVSTGCIYEGNNYDWCESDSPSPAIWYSQTKNMAEQIITGFGYDNYLILRPRQLISKKSHPSNVITKFAKLSSINAIDEKNSMTCIEDMVEIIDHLLINNATGTYNCCNAGTLTPYYIASRIRETISPELKVNKVAYEKMLSRMKVKRVNATLSTKKLSGLAPPENVCGE